jgi:adenosine kinase
VQSADPPKRRSLATTLRTAEKFDKSHLSSLEVAPLVDGAKVFYVEGYFLTHGIESALEVAQRSQAAGKVSYTPLHRLLTARLRMCQVFALNLSVPFIPQFFKANVVNLLPYCDIVIGNESEAAAWASVMDIQDMGNIPLIAKSLAMFVKATDARPCIVVITHGASPTVVVTGDAPDSPKSFPVTLLSDAQIIDTNGAGDAFAGGFLGAFVAGKGLDECVLTGHQLAALLLTPGRNLI